MPGVVQHTPDSLLKAAVEAVEAGVGGLMIFGVPAHKDARGSGADDPDGILNVALRALRAELGDATVLMADLCLDEFTDHGHCGVLAARRQRSTTTRPCSGTPAMALAQAEAGAHLLGTSGMMDGQVGAVRAALDAAGHRRHRHPRLRAEVRVGVLRTVPRGGQLLARRRPQDLPAGPGAHGAPRRWPRSRSTSPRAPTS